MFLAEPGFSGESFLLRGVGIGYAEVQARTP